MNTAYSKVNDQYSRWLDMLGFAYGTVYDYSNCVRDFFEWLNVQGMSRIDQLQQKHVTTYFNYLETRPNKRRKGHLLSVSHLNHNFAAIDKLLEFLHAHGLKNAPEPTNYRLHVDKDERIRKIETLTQDEVRELHGAIEHSYTHLNYVQCEAKHYQLKLIFALFYGCGLRMSEGAKLRLENIDFDRRTVFVEKGKNYKDRFVPMSDGVYKTLQQYIYNFRHLQKLPHNRLFICSKGGLNRMIKDLQSVCENDQIQQKRLSLHVLRHSIATHLLQNGMSIENISQFLGHSSLESTQIYTHLVE